MTENRKIFLERRSKKEEEIKIVIEKRKREAVPNRKSASLTKEDEIKERQELIEEKLKFIKNILPDILKRLSQIPDPRQPIKVKHSIAVLTLYGILIFLYQLTSRREANREITEPIFFDNLESIFPELKTMPHADTLARLLERIDLEVLSDEASNIIKAFIRKKKFKNLLINKGYLIAIDGTGKFSRDRKWSKECLEKKVGKTVEGEEDKKKYYAYVVEACLIFAGGLVLPFESEFLEYSPEITGEVKKDCESKGFKRLVARISKKFPKLKIAIVADGLFTNGPAIDLLKSKGWQYMIMLKDDSLTSVWDQFNENMKMEKDINTFHQIWGNREQTFYFSNEIDYKYEQDGKVKRTEVHVIVCEETWEELKIDGTLEKKYSKYAWISDQSLTKKNIHIRCNLMGRARWWIESNILLEKHYGYSYEHCFSYTWQAMKGYHYLMHIAHIINAIMFKTEYFFKKVKEKTMRGVIKLFQKALQSTFLDKERFSKILSQKHQIRFADMQ